MNNGLSGFILDVVEIQKSYSAMKTVTKAEICRICIPFRDKYELKDSDALTIARNQISLAKIVELYNEKIAPHLNSCDSCEYCDFSSGDVGAVINNSEDSFVLISTPEGVVIATDDKHFKTLKIDYCPMCGRELRKERDNEG